MKKYVVSFLAILATIQSSSAEKIYNGIFYGSSDSMSKSGDGTATCIAVRVTGEGTATCIVAKPKVSITQTQAILINLEHIQNSTEKLSPEDRDAIQKKLEDFLKNAF